MFSDNQTDRRTVTQENDICPQLLAHRASLIAQLVKNLPAMQETPVQLQGWEDSPGEGKDYPTPVFWSREFRGLYSPWGCKESDTTERLSLSLAYNS